MKADVGVPMLFINIIINHDINKPLFTGTVFDERGEIVRILHNDSIFDLEKALIPKSMTRNTRYNSLYPENKYPNRYKISVIYSINDPKLAHDTDRVRCNIACTNLKKNKYVQEDVDKN